MKEDARVIALVFAIQWGFLFTVLAADPPGILSHQGRIAVNNSNFDGTGYFKFSLVKDADQPGEMILWHHDVTATIEDEPTGEVSVTVNKGHYGVLLGETPAMTAIPDSIFADNNHVSLRIWFSTASGGGFHQLSPDRRITTVGYAMVAKTAASADAVKDGAITGASIAAGAVNGSKIATGAVDTSALADGAVSGQKMSAGAAAANLSASGFSGVPTEVGGAKRKIL